MSAVVWTLTHPTGSGTATLAALGISAPQVTFRTMAASRAVFTVARDFDSEAPWWAADSLVTLYRAGQPFFTGRVQECPDAATADSETRTLLLVDAWQDLEEVIYREPWGIGTGTFLYPRAILGMDAAGSPIPTGAQIGEVIDYAITQGVDIQKGTIAAGIQLWPSEVRNTSCEAILSGQLRFHPDWVAWLDHTTSPPTFHARPKAELAAVTVDITSGTVAAHRFAPVVRNVPRGVSIVYESASTIDGEVYRTGYVDEAGETTGRRVMRAMLDLEGLNAAYQKSRIQTRTLPTDAATMKAYFKKKWPELKDIPDAAFSFSNVTFSLAPEEPAPDPVCPKAERLAVAAAEELPRELVSGGIEDWMRVKAGRVIVKYDMAINDVAGEDERKLLGNFAGEAKTFSVTATNAVTKTYKGISSWTEGESAPVELAAAIFAAATEPQFEGTVSTQGDDIPGGCHHARALTLTHGTNPLMEHAVIHTVTADIETGRLDRDFGPMPYLSAGDFLELQRMFQGRPVTWMSPEERTANTLGAEGSAGSRGDIVAPYDVPDTITPPGGGGGETREMPFHATKVMDGETMQLAVAGGAWQAGAQGAWVSIGPTAAAAGTRAYLVINAVTETGAINTVTVSVTTDDLDEIVVSGSGTISNVLLAEVIDGQVVQRRHGNFLIGFHQLDGDVVRWPDTLAGTIQPPPPPEEL